MTIEKCLKMKEKAAPATNEEAILREATSIGILARKELKINHENQ